MSDICYIKTFFFFLDTSPQLHFIETEVAAAQSIQSVLQLQPFVSVNQANSFGQQVSLLATIFCLPLVCFSRVLFLSNPPIDAPSPTMDVRNWVELHRGVSFRQKQNSCSCLFSSETNLLLLSHYHFQFSSSFYQYRNVEVILLATI